MKNNSKSLKRVFALLLVFCCLFSFAACKDDDGKDGDKDVKLTVLDLSAEEAAESAEDKGATAIVATVYSESYDDGAVLSYSPLDDAKSGECFTILVNDLSIKEQLKNLPLVPMVIEKSRYEELIQSKVANDGTATTKLKAYYSLFDPSDSSLSDSAKKEMKANYPITEDMAVYVFDLSASLTEIESIEKYITEKTEYTYDDMLKDYIDTHSIPTPVAEMQAVKITADDCKYEENDGKITITSCKTDAENIIIPAEIDNKPVVKLEGNVFSSTSIHSVTFENGIEKIESGAFANAFALHEFNLPDSIMHVALDAFGNLIFNKTDDAGFTTFSDILFDYSGDDTEIVIPDAINHISDEIFMNNRKITKVTLPATLKSLGDKVFYKCDSLADINYTDTEIRRIGAECFGFCTLFTEVTITDKIVEVGDKAFIECYNATALNLGSSLEIIGNNSFDYLLGITAVTLPDSVKSIGDGAFNRCRALETVNFGANITFVGINAFTETAWINSVSSLGEFAVIGDGVLISYNGKAADVTIPSNVKHISCAFYENSSIQNVTIPEGVLSITSKAFAKSKNLVKVTIPASVTFIANYVFQDCSSNLIIACPAGSYAATYAKTAGYKTENS